MPTTEIKNKILPISVISLIAMLLFVWTLSRQYTNEKNETNTKITQLETSLNTRLVAIESKMNEGGRYTSEDGAIVDKRLTLVEGDIEDIKQNKADKGDLRVIETRLASIEALLMELKEEIKK